MRVLSFARHHLRYPSARLALVCIDVVLLYLLCSVLVYLVQDAAQAKSRDNTLSADAFQLALVDRQQRGVYSGHCYESCILL